VRGEERINQVEIDPAVESSVGIVTGGSTLPRRRHRRRTSALTSISPSFVLESLLELGNLSLATHSLRAHAYPWHWVPARRVMFSASLRTRLPSLRTSLPSLPHARPPPRPFPVRAFHPSPLRPARYERFPSGQGAPSPGPSGRPDVLGYLRRRLGGDRAVWVYGIAVGGGGLYYVTQ
jgi:hypothetical protein